jgi:hypothetical protein
LALRNLGGDADGGSTGKNEDRNQKEQHVELRSTSLAARRQVLRARASRDMKPARERRRQKIDVRPMRFSSKKYRMRRLERRCG